jgi:5-(carboxyamino)imidazole ribonucleotide synthase
MAPRVHNSGHWTIEGSKTSQFENHLRAVLGWPLGPTEMRAAGLSAAMVNIIGGEPDAAAVLRADASVHMYGKRPRPGRKLGHATVVVGSSQVISKVGHLRELIDPTNV